MMAQQTHTRRRAGPAAGIGASLISRLDVSEDEPLKDAVHQLRRCVSADDYMAWATTWGEPALARLQEFVGIDEDYVTHEEHESSLESKRAIEDGADAFLTAVRETLKDGKGPKTDAINAEADKFAAILAEHEEQET